MMAASRWIWIAAALFALAGCADGGPAGDAAEAPLQTDFAGPANVEGSPDPFPDPFFVGGGLAAPPQTTAARPVVSDPDLSALMGGRAAPGAGLVDGGRAPTAAAPVAAADAGTMNAWLDGVAAQGAAPGDVVAAAAAAPAGGFGVQIASYKKRAAAEKGWSLFKQRYGGLLNAYQRRIVEADIPGRGRFYRLVAVGGDRLQLVGLCDQIQARGGSCLLRRI